MPTLLADLSRGRDNNLTLLRFLAATAVVYAHSFGILGKSAAEPFYRLMHRGLGDFGVDIFFVVSGFLVTKSLIGKESVGTFAWARAARVYPALWISTLFWIAVAGLFLTVLPPSEFWTDRATLSYLFKNSLMLPGIGAQLELPNTGLIRTEFNTPLWTLPHELQMYGLLAVLGATGVIRLRWSTVALSIAGAATVFVIFLRPEFAAFESRARFIYFFFAGSSFFLFRDVIKLETKMFLGALAIVAVTCLATSDTSIRQGALALVTPYVTLYLAYVPRGAIRRFNKLGDYSYGIYILAFPLQLILATYLSSLSPLGHFGMSMLCTLPLACLSWHVIEERALRAPAPAWLRHALRLKVSAPSKAATEPAI